MMCPSVSELQAQGRRPRATIVDNTYIITYSVTFTGHKT